MHNLSNQKQSCIFLNYNQTHKLHLRTE
jgi:hypothetical protein